MSDKYDQICTTCGYRYGDHVGINCPETNNPQWKPSNMYMTSKEHDLFIVKLKNEKVLLSAKLKKALKPISIRLKESYK